MVSRRGFLIGAVGGVAALGLARPRQASGAHSDYFASLNAALRSAGVDTPSIIIDLDRLDRNIDRVVRSVGSGSNRVFRVVTKSLPSPELVRYICQRAGTQAQMVFHRPFLQAVANAFPEHDLLLGKPMPVSALQRFYSEHDSVFDPATQLQWLVDTPERLQEYLQFARSNGVRLNINFELDVGLHRGGMQAGQTLADAFAIIRGNGEQLGFSGFMGYDAHLKAVPTMLFEHEFDKVRQRYSSCMNLLASDFPDLLVGAKCFNGAGSPTFRHYEQFDLINDVAVGSALLKPKDFDLPVLDDFEPAAFIASPVLKRLDRAEIPALEWATTLRRAWNPNNAEVVFGYGGNWLAELESPQGVTPDGVYRSSNQQGYLLSRGIQLDVKDYLFLRPTQSESVLLQFGDLIAMRNGKLVEQWPVLAG